MSTTFSLFAGSSGRRGPDSAAGARFFRVARLELGMSASENAAKATHITDYPVGVMSDGAPVVASYNESTE
jgi:hypothetical protein